MEWEAWSPEALLAIGLGMTAASFATSEDDLDRSACAYSMRQRACSDVLEGRELSFVRLDELRSAAAEAGTPLIVAATELGSISLSAAALRACGVAVATPYWEASRRYRALAERVGATLIDLNTDNDARGLSRALREHQLRGRVPFLVVEAPSRSPRHFTFLNGQVRCSRYVSWLARETGSRVLLLWNLQRLGGLVEVRFDTITPDAADTQRLLDRIDAEVRREPAQYAWENSAILFSHEGATRRAFDGLGLILEWRRRWMTARTPYDCGR